MRHSQRRNQYPLTELLREKRETFPAGESLAIKRVGFPDRYGDADRLMKLRIVRAAPELYVTGKKATASGLVATGVRVGIEHIASTETTRHSGEIDQRPLTVTEFAGRVLLPRGLSDISVVGAYVPGEPYTGFLHVLDSEQIVALFQR
jgi:hypothetical protein